MSASASSTSSFFVDFSAGAIGGAVGKYLEYPLDAVKTKMQSGLPAYSNKSTAEVLRYVARVEGLHGFYAGVAAPAFGCAVECSVAFSLFYGVSDLLCKYTDRRRAASSSSSSTSRTTTTETTRATHHEYWVVSLSGAAGGVANGFLLTPVEKVKCLCQSSPTNYPSVRVALRKTLQEEGWRGFGAGLSGTMLREVIGSTGFFFMIEWTTRNAFSQHLMPNGDFSESAPLYCLPVCGGMAGFGLLLPTFCFDSVKTLMQVDEKMNRLGFFGCSRHVYRTGGVAGFYHGFGITMLRAFPSNAAIVTMAEYLRYKLSSG